MKQTVSTSWAIGKWADRATLNYVPIDQPIGQRHIDAFGELSRFRATGAVERRIVTAEVIDDATMYERYSASTGEIPIIKTVITKED